MLMRMRRLPILFLLLATSVPLSAQSSWFQPALLDTPEMRTALKSIDERATGIVDEWITLVEMPAPSGQEQARAAYIKTEMEKLGLSDIRTDDISNVSGVRKGTGGGPTVVFAAHMDTVFPKTTDLKVKRDGDILRAPGVGDDTANLLATLEMFRALNRGNIKTKGDLIFLASVQEELGLLGAKHWLEASGYKPDMFVAIDLSSNEVWYGALRISQFKFFYTSPGAHTMESRGGPSPAHAVAKAIEALYDLPLPAIASGLGSFKLPTLNVGMLGGGTVVNAVPREAWFTVDLRSLDTATQERLEAAVVSTAQHTGEKEGVGFRMEKKMGIDYTKARPQQERLNHPLVQTALATANQFRKPGSPAIEPADVGSTDANIAVSMGIPAVAVGARIGRSPHQLEENADASTIVPGIKSLIALAVALTNH
jgi:acetylornithine deacetylase/succinyl-diaminopimelate desuccinylase-like protein